MTNNKHKSISQRLTYDLRRRRRSCIRIYAYIVFGLATVGIVSLATLNTARAQTQTTVQSYPSVGNVQPGVIVALANTQSTIVTPVYAVAIGCWGSAVRA
jgi:hypothetical protein